VIELRVCFQYINYKNDLQNLLLFDSGGMCFSGDVDLKVRYGQIIYCNLEIVQEVYKKEDTPTGGLLASPVCIRRWQC